MAKKSYTAPAGVKLWASLQTSTCEGGGAAAVLALVGHKRGDSHVPSCANPWVDN
eukprot:CAMPEP_0179172264 /NCGR_PEP_ID=MMETSP0796-20121207/84953_1 /TAXON_ID=73915 /ORGANISM="Pyrodinium bahamense, Strain pbaha01" /LENGTH=54 /DNA_ID=CAMNT_0020875395 /DNA_START=26 /DNA_END=187 /DNA_ORIENTATION=+